MSNILTISPSPHFKDKPTVKSLMFGVLTALIPAFCVSLYVFGIGTLLTTVFSVVFCVAFEWLITKYMLNRQPTITDGSAILTGVLLAFNLPSDINPGIILVGALVAIGIGKMTFGGLGNNLFNPALVGRVFLLISFPKQMTTWPIPQQPYFDAMTGATPLVLIKDEYRNAGVQAVDDKMNFMDMFLGIEGGSLGEIAAIALIIGGAYMIWKKIITWHIPTAIIATVLIFSGLLWLIDSSTFVNPLFHILNGGLLLGAIFMATDYVTSPMSNPGKIVYGVGIGLLTVIIRIWGSYPEGMSFAILIMNAVVPLINRGFKPVRFGATQTK